MGLSVPVCLVCAEGCNHAVPCLFESCRPVNAVVELECWVLTQLCGVQDTSSTAVYCLQPVD
jgi:hypothetical protein